MLSSQAYRFGDALVERRVITREEMEAGLELASASGMSFTEVLQQRFDVPPADVAAAWAAVHGMTYVDFASSIVEPEATITIPAEMARANRAVPVSLLDGHVLVAFQHPTSRAAVQVIAEHLAGQGLELEPGLSEEEGIVAALSVAYPEAGQAEDTKVKASEALGYLSRLFDRTIELGASDLHLAAGQPPCVRVIGELIRMPDEPVLSAARVRELVYSILSQRQQQRFEEVHELDTSHAHGTRTRFRVNVFVQRNAVGAAFRVIPYEVVPFEHLGMPEIVRGFANFPRGLVLVTGPTGSGKSTTLASLVNIVNETRRCHIITIEDPIEFVHHSKMALVNQREVGGDTNSFGQALTSAMRQDPDVILVGEMRDLETISTAITAAETGHLVYATLHTQDAAQTVDRIIDVFPGEQQSQVRIQLANSLQAVVTQQLVPTADGRSRAVASEILVSNTAVRALIRDGKIHQIHNAMMQGKRNGMQLMNDSLADLVNRGVVTFEQAARRSNTPDDLARMCGQPVPQV
ncbi:MAG: PilT/PilU family type 4a pilus ATPase [Acidimicrobiales bacterium]|nr:PilT/PilU family type 4a pilus ATPase [Acidimicrobiales bacterium]